MIRYDLVCDAGHLFDGWFRDSAAYDRQASQQLVTCPACGSSSVQKQLMAPALSRGRRAQVAPAEAPAEPVAERPCAPREPTMAAAAMTPDQKKLLDAVRKLRRHVESTAENVGARFAEEARRMHYGEAGKRSIYGEASLPEAKALHEEGIEVAPLPRLPEDRH